MNNLVVTQNIPKIQSFTLNWRDNAPVQKLLDVVVEIMAEEYVRVARRNEDVFSDPSTPSPSARSLGMTNEGPEVLPAERSKK